jgi:putative ABC transport system substrate-binding protein
MRIPHRNSTVLSFFGSTGILALRRREFILLLGGAAAWPITADAQHPDSPSKLNIVGVIAPPFSAVDGLRQGFRELGYVEGQNLRLEYRWVEGSIEQYTAVVFELIKLGAAAVVVYGTPAALGAKEATTTLPIVVAAMGDPIGTGIVSSLARPGGNITGFSSLTSDLEPKRLEILKEGVPQLSRVGMLWNSGNPAVLPNSIAVRGAASQMGLTLDSEEVRDQHDFEVTFQHWRHNRPDGVLVLTDPMFLNHAPRILSFMAEQRLPAIYSHRDFVAGGGLISYGTNYRDLFRRAAGYVDKVLKGTNPADLPVQQPTKFELVINKKTATTLGLNVPNTLLVAADEVIE